MSPRLLLRPYTITPMTGRSYPALKMQLRVERRPAYYAFNVGLPMATLSLMASLIFLVPLDEGGVRLDLAFALMLTCVTYKSGVISHVLPAVAYQSTPSATGTSTRLRSNLVRSVLVTPTKVSEAKPMTASRSLFAHCMGVATTDSRPCARLVACHRREVVLYWPVDNATGAARRIDRRGGAKHEPRGRRAARRQRGAIARDLMAPRRLAWALALATLAGARAAPLWRPWPRQPRQRGELGARKGALADDLSMRITSVGIASSVVPQAVVVRAAHASGIFSDPPAKGALKNLTVTIDDWYRDNGYVLARVDNRKPVRNGFLLLIPSEPRVAEEPVEMHFYAPASADAPVDNDASAPAEGRAALGQACARGELARVRGKMRAKVVADALGLRARESFRLTQARRDALSQCGAFDKFAATWRTRDADDGVAEVSLRAEAIEAANVRSIRASLVPTGTPPTSAAAAGEMPIGAALTLADANWRGANQRLSLSLRRAATAPADFSIRLTDPRIGRRFSTDGALTAVPRAGADGGPDVSASASLSAPLSDGGARATAGLSARLVRSDDADDDGQTPVVVSWRARSGGALRDRPRGEIAIDRSLPLGERCPNFWSLTATARTDGLVGPSARAELSRAMSGAPSPRGSRDIRYVARARAAWSGGEKPTSRVDGLSDGVVRGYDSTELGSDSRAVAGTLELVVPLTTDSNANSVALFADAGARARVHHATPDGTDGASAWRRAGGWAAGASGGCGVRLGSVRVDAAWNVRGERRMHIGLVA